MMNIVSLSASQTLPIRHHVLWPDKPEKFCILPDDENGTHFGIEVKGELICVASLFWLHNDVRLRKFATINEFQGMGFGSKLLHFMLNEMKQQGASTFFCDARTTAENFYTKFGLQKSGKSFDKSGVSYYKMSKTL